MTKIEVCSQEDQESGEYVDDETEDSEFEDATYFLDDPAIEKL